MRNLILCICVLHLSGLYAQRERVHLDLDKYTCRAGDTIWFKGFVFKGAYPSSTSTNLYVELYNEAGLPVKEAVFPLLRGQSIGQLTLPDSLPTSNYYLVALTRQQMNYPATEFFSVPLLVYNRSRPSLIHHKKWDPGPPGVTAGTIDGITWVTNVTGNGLSVLLRADSLPHPRRLHLMKTINNNEVLRSDITLDKGLIERYVLLPIDSVKECEELLLYEDSALIGRQCIALHQRPRNIQVYTDTLDPAPHACNSWNIKLPDSTIFFTSISITDADRSVPSPRPIGDICRSYTDELCLPDSLTDSSFVTLTGQATRLSGKKIKDPFSREIVFMGSSDTSYLFTRVARITPEGKFSIDSLFFFGHMNLRFQLNKGDYADSKDIQLHLQSSASPKLDPEVVTSGWENDASPISAIDTALTATELKKYELAKMKTLRAVTVKGWKNPRTELDATYTTGPFSEPALYSYDLRDDSSEYNRNLSSYLNSKCGRLRYDPARDTIVDVMGHPIRYFVNEMEYDYPSLRAFDFEGLAYIKVLESDFLSSGTPIYNLVPISFIAQLPGNLKSPNTIAPSGTDTRDQSNSMNAPGAGGGGASEGVPTEKLIRLRIPDKKTALNVCIYTRKGKDFRTMRGGLNTVSIKGYDNILPFTPDGETLYWNPFQSGSQFTVRFNNSETARRFRLKIEGISYTGKVLHYETVITQDDALSAK